MKKKCIWVVVSCLMVLSLVIASCGPAEEEEEEEVGEEEVVITEEEEEEEEEVVEEEEGLLPPDVPKYGGVINTYRSSDPTGFDDAILLSWFVANAVTHDELAQGDWTKGPVGTGETDWLYGNMHHMSLETGCMAESWELPDDETIIYHIRKGVHWQDKPPVNGREFDAYDAAWNINRAYTAPGAYLTRTYGKDVAGGMYAPISVEALDKWTVEMKVHPGGQGFVINYASDFLRHYPRDAVELYGDMMDWRVSCGTGPFMITDYVPGTSLTYVRNPNYWETDPIGPGKGNQLPYADGFHEMIIVDQSTRLAAFRTGKLDLLTGVGWEDAELLLEQCPGMKYTTRVKAPMAVWMRVDKPDIPLYKVEVRQALNMAVNQQEIVDDYYGGAAQAYGYPFADTASHASVRTPFEELPERAQKLFGYYPEEAKQLLADAGYPDGFKFSVYCGSATQSDELSIIKEYLEDIDVEMDIKLVEPVTYESVARARSHEEAIYDDTKNDNFPWRMLDSTDCSDNPSCFSSEETDKALEEITSLMGKDDAACDKIIKDLNAFRIQQACGIWMPATNTATMWWPWIQNFRGEQSVGMANTTWPKYIWVDEALKASMGY